MVIDESSEPTGKTTRINARLVDVARAAGVAPITVSRALNSPDQVRIETRMRIEEAMRQTGYVPNALAATLRSGQSNTIIVVLPSLTNQHLSEEVRGLTDSLGNRGYRLLFTQTGWNGELQTETVQEFLPLRPAGVVMASVTTTRACRSLLLDCGVPVVELGDTNHGIDMIVSVSSFESGRLLGAHLRESGYRNIAFCGHTLGHGARRLDGLRSALGTAEIFVLSIEGVQGIVDGMVALDRVLEEFPACDAVVFGSDILALGALLRARERGHDVPGRIAIAGYGDLDFAAHLSPALTTVRMPHYATGAAAGRMLLDRITNGTVAQHSISLTPELVLRAST